MQPSLWLCAAVRRTLGRSRLTQWACQSPLQHQKQLRHGLSVRGGAEMHSATSVPPLLLDPGMPIGYHQNAY